MAETWFTESLAIINQASLQLACERQMQLTKPAGSLGMLEEVACRLAGMQGSNNPQIENPAIRLFAADHGIARSGVSAFPQEVTVQMIANFCNGGAAISVMAKRLAASLQIIDMGTCSSPLAIAGVVDRSIAQGTQNFIEHPAMTQTQLLQAFDAGKEQAELLHEQASDLYIAGEMGIGNTSSATALACLLLDLPVAQLVGPGTGLDAQQLAHKQALLEQALEVHRQRLGSSVTDPLVVLASVGGFEIAAITASYIRCAQLGIPVLVDGFITNVALLCAERILPGVVNWVFVAHASAEPGHRAVLDTLDIQPLLHLNMRLGEGSGAAIAVTLLQSACTLHNEMATFAEAAVSNGE